MIGRLSSGNTGFGGTGFGQKPAGGGGSFIPASGIAKAATGPRSGFDPSPQLVTGVFQSAIPSAITPPVTPKTPEQIYAEEAAPGLEQERIQQQQALAASEAARQRYDQSLIDATTAAYVTLETFLVMLCSIHSRLATLTLHALSFTTTNTTSLA